MIYIHAKREPTAEGGLKRDKTFTLHIKGMGIFIKRPYLCYSSLKYAKLAETLCLKLPGGEADRAISQDTSVEG